MKAFGRIVIICIIVFSSQAFCQVLEIHHVNVGQGDSTLIVGPNGTTILIDAGNSGYFSLDGGKIVFEYLESIGINHLDYIVVTHRDGDHVGGFAFSTYATSRHSLLMAEREAGGVIKSWAGLSGIDDDGNGFTDFIGDDGCPNPADPEDSDDSVKTPDPAEITFNGSDPYFPLIAYDNGEESTISYCSLTKTFRRYVQTVEAAGVRNPLGTYAGLMDTYNNPIDLGDNATATFVCSSGWIAGNPTRVSGTDGTSSLAVNSRSVGIYIQYKGFDYIVAGDLTGNESPYMEQALRDSLISVCDSPVNDPVDVMRINHHGSDSSSEQSYLNDMRPEVAIMSLGDANSYGHPKQEVIDRLYATYLQPLMHIYLTEAGETGRDFYEMPHDVLNGAVVVRTDGNTYSITNSSGGLDEFYADNLIACKGDYDMDRDIDGNDLSKHIISSVGTSLGEFASNFGTTNCLN